MMMMNTTTTSTTTFNIQCTKFYLTKANLSDMKRYLLYNEKEAAYSTNRATAFEAINKPIIFTHRSINTFTCLDKVLAKRLQCLLPKRIAISSNWSLVYSLDQHGASLNTLYNKTSNSSGPCLLVIQNNNNEIFGAYLSESVHIESSYYGTGECFLWKLNRETNQIIPYYWSMLNDYMIYSNHEFFAIGGGQGKFGLWLNSDLEHGYTQPCATFNNTNLCKDSAFHCTALEIWNFKF